jgi:hypothetical protein
MTCRHGDFDLAFAPSGTGGYDDLVHGSQPVFIGAVEVRVAALDDVIRSKEAAGRPKDIAVLPVLEQHARRLRDATGGFGSGSSSPPPPSSG